MTVLHVRTHHLHVRTIGGAGETGGAQLDVAAALERAELPEPHGLWFLDRVDARVCVRDDLGGRSGADLLAREIARAVRAVLDGDRGQDGVRWFPDRVTYLVHWVIDLSTGHAGEHWEYAQLGTGDFSPALRERAQAEPGALLVALRSLSDDEIDRMVLLLTPADAAAIVHAVAIGTGAVNRRVLAGTAAQLWRGGRFPRDSRRATLAVLLRADRSDDPPDPASAATARDLALLCAALRECDPARRGALLTAARTADAGALAALGHGELAAALASWPDADRNAALAALDAADSSGPEPGRTPHGGLFLLLPLVAELPLAEATAGWPDASGGDTAPGGDTAAGADAAALIAALAIGAVLGIGIDVLADPWARLALGLPRDIARHAVAWSNQPTAAQIDRFTDGFAAAIEHRELALTGDLTEPSLLLAPPLSPPVAQAVRVAAGVLARELSHRLPGQARAGLDHLRRNVLAGGATVRADKTAFVVELDPPPLAVLLSLTGMNRRRFTLPATGDRTWTLRQRS